MISKAIRRLFRKIEFGDSFQFRLRLDPFDINAGVLDQRHRSSGQAHRWAFAKNPHGAVSLFQSLAFRRQALNGRRFSIDENSTWNRYLDAIGFTRGLFSFSLAARGRNQKRESDY